MRGFRWMKDGILLLLLAGFTIFTLTAASTKQADRFYHEHISAQAKSNTEGATRSHASVQAFGGQR